MVAIGIREGEERAHNYFWGIRPWRGGINPLPACEILKGAQVISFTALLENPCQYPKPNLHTICNQPSEPAFELNFSRRSSHAVFFHCV
jgi:hypothetical protein